MSHPLNQRKRVSRSLFPLCLIVSVCIVLLMFASPVKAATIRYVDVNQGTDVPGQGTGPGAAAWQTIGYALSQVTSISGPVELNVSAGIYDFSSGPYTMTRSDLSIKGEGAGKTILDGAATASGAFMILSVDNIVIEGLTIRNFGSPSKGIAIDDTNGTMIASTEIQGCETGIEIEDCSPDIFMCKIHNNSIAGIMVYPIGVEASPLIARCEIFKNGFYGISVYTGGQTSNIKIRNNLIYSDQTTQQYGVFLYANPAAVFAEIYHNTFDMNQTAAVHCDNTAAGADIRYNIITASPTGIEATDPIVVIDYNNVWNCTTLYGGAASAGSNDISQDPKYGSYSLRSDSPCIDAIPPSAGDPVNEDFQQQSRPIGDGYDMGAYEYASTETVSINLPAGTTVQAYRLVSMPVLYANPAANNILGPQVGTYDTTRMRIGHWENNNQSYYEYPTSSDWLPGISAWFLFRDGITLNFTGSQAPTLVPPGLSDPYCEIPIKPGWNMVGNPFHFAIDLGGDNVVVSEEGASTYYNLLTDNPVTLNRFYVYNNGGYGLADSLAAGQGGWVKKTSSGTGRIWFKLKRSATQTLGEMTFQPLSADDESPPPPPGGISGDSGGGAGGCFIGSTLDKYWY